MTSSSIDPVVLRLLDANLDRAREGLRVAEDWARFGLNRRDLVEPLKDLRQQLGRCHLPEYRQARHTASDAAAGLAHPAQAERLNPQAVVAANCARAQEALRVLEEFGRASNPDLAATAETCRYRLYDLETQLLADQSRRQRLRDARLYLITSAVPQMLEVVEQALREGVRLVQHRSKTSADGERYQEALALRKLCDRYNSLLIINDRVDIALAVEADGVHLGQGDMPITLARRLIGPDRLIGVSSHCLDDLQKAQVAGCDYLGVGPIYTTPTKPGRAAVGFSYLKQAAANAQVPFFAIGGLEAANLEPVLAEAGPNAAVAVVRAVMEAADPGAATKELLKLLNRSY